MIPFLMVPETRAPTRTAPKNSNTEAARMACFMVSDRDETAGAKELATLSQESDDAADQVARVSHSLVGTDVVSIESTEDDTKGEEVVPLVESRHVCRELLDKFSVSGWRLMVSTGQWIPAPPARYICIPTGSNPTFSL